MPDEKPNETAANAQDDKLAATVAAAVTAGLKTALPEAIKPFADQISGGSIRREAAPAPRQVQQIQDVSEEAIAEAMANGDKAEISRLLKQQRAAERQRADAEIQRITAAGSAAFGSVARLAAERLPHYKGKFKALIDAEIDKFKEFNPGVMPTFEHYEAAHNLVLGANYKEAKAMDREEEIRAAREKEEALIPSGGRGDIEETEREPENLSQVLAGDWKKEFRTKQRAVGGRSDDEELRKLDYRGGLKEFVQARKQMEAIEDETGGSFGLDRDWVDESGRQGQRANKEKGAWV